MKRLVARASLKSTLEHHILTLQQMFEWCNQSIKGIQIYFVSTQDIDKHKHAETYKLEDRYRQLKRQKTVWNPLSPVSQYQLDMRRISEDILLKLGLVKRYQHLLKITAHSNQVHGMFVMAPGMWAIYEIVQKTLKSSL